MIEFYLPSMTCGHCVSRVTQAVKQADPAATVTVDLQAHRARVEGGKEDREAIAEALRDAGYPPV